MAIGYIPAPVRKVAAIADSDGQADRSGRKPRKGRPRSEEAERAILQAAAEVLATRGLSGMSIEDVASRAGVGKATIYRRWSSKGALALDTFLADTIQQLRPPDTGTLRGDLRLALRSLVHSAALADEGGLLAGLVAQTKQDPELAAGWRDRVVTPIRKMYLTVIDRAIRRGEIPADTDADVALDLLFGAASYRLLNGDRPLSDQFVERIADVITAGLAAPC